MLQRRRHDGRSCSASGKILSYRPLASPRVTFTERPKPKTPASTTKELKCDKCDGPHATEDCPFFKGDRDDHPDARNRAPHEGLGSDGGRAVLRQARVVRQPGDGSCLFHSLAHGLRDARVADYDHRRLRQALMDWLARHEDLKIADTPVRDWVLWDANQAVPAYVGRMRIGGWGGGMLAPKPPLLFPTVPIVAPAVEHALPWPLLPFPAIPPFAPSVVPLLPSIPPLLLWFAMPGVGALNARLL